MEPLRVLELYSGIGGMHQALRGERAHPISLGSRRAAGPSLGAGEGRSDEAPGAESGARGVSVRRGEGGALGCPGNRPGAELGDSGRRLPSSLREAFPRGPRGVRVDWVCES